MRITGNTTWRALVDLSYRLTNDFPKDTDIHPDAVYMHERLQNGARRGAASRGGRGKLDLRDPLALDFSGAVVESAFGVWVPLLETEVSALQWESLTSKATLTANPTEDGWSLTYDSPPLQEGEPLRESAYLSLFFLAIGGNLQHIRDVVGVFRKEEAAQPQPQSKRPIGLAAGSFPAPQHDPMMLVPDSEAGKEL